MLRLQTFCGILAEEVVWLRLRAELLLNKVLREVIVQEEC